jgi:hypothetical protein
MVKDQECRQIGVCAQYSAKISAPACLYTAPEGAKRRRRLVAPQSKLYKKYVKREQAGVCPIRKQPPEELTAAHRGPQTAALTTALLHHWLSICRKVSQS